MPDTLNQILYKEIVSNIINKKLNKYDAKDELVDILEKYQVKKQENDPRKYLISHNIESYLKELMREGMSDHTISAYKIQLSIFSKYFKDRKIQELTKEDIVEFLEHREKTSGLKLSTLESIRSIVRAFFVWLEDEKIIDKSSPRKLVTLVMSKWL